MRSLRFEFNLDSNQWPSLLPLVNYVLNHTPRTLTGHTPAEIMTGMKRTTVLDPIIYTPHTGFSRTPVTMEQVQHHVHSLRESLSELHKEVKEIVDKRRSTQRKAGEIYQKLNLYCLDWVILFW